MGRPAELYIDEKWDRFLDLTLRRTVYGALLGGAAALALLRASPPHPRASALRRMSPQRHRSRRSRRSRDAEPLAPLHAPPHTRPAGSPCARSAALTFGAGVGAGSAWQACSKDVRVCARALCCIALSPARCYRHGRCNTA
jgi:hypothetical protein